MIWAYIIWIACLSFATPSSAANLRERNVETKIHDELHFVVQNDVLLSEEEPYNLSIDAVEPKTITQKNIAVTVRFYIAAKDNNHTEKLNPLTLDLPPPFCPHRI